MKPELTIRLTMKKESEGGRHGPFTAGYCPHLVATASAEWLGVRVSASPGPVPPGDTADVRVELLYHPNLDYSVLSPGAQFQVMEGPRVVGEGTVLAPIA